MQIIKTEDINDFVEKDIERIINLLNNPSQYKEDGVEDIIVEVDLPDPPVFEDFRKGMCKAWNDIQTRKHQLEFDQVCMSRALRGYANYDGKTIRYKITLKKFKLKTNSTIQIPH